MKNRIKLTGIMLKALLVRALLVPGIIVLAALSCKPKKQTVENYFEWVEESTATFLQPETNGYDPMLEESFAVAYIAHFNNETIPMTLFYSPLSYGGYYLNSLEFMYDGAKQTVRIENGEDMMPISNIDADNIGGISLDDFNFDGYADIAVFWQSGYGANEWYEIYLYNPQTKSYYRHEKLSEMCGVRADTETKTVKSSGRTSFYGYNFDEYKWDNGQLTLIYSEKYDTVGDSDLYEHATGTLQNGSWTEQTEYFRYDSDGNEIKVEIME